MLRLMTVLMCRRPCCTRRAVLLVAVTRKGRKCNCQAQKNGQGYTYHTKFRGELRLILLHTAIFVLTSTSTMTLIISFKCFSHGSPGLKFRNIYSIRNSCNFVSVLFINLLVGCRSADGVSEKDGVHQKFVGAKPKCPKCGVIGKTDYAAASVASHDN